MKKVHSLSNFRENIFNVFMPGKFVVDNDSQDFGMMNSFNHNACSKVVYRAWNKRLFGLKIENFRFRRIQSQAVLRRPPHDVVEFFRSMVIIVVADKVQKADIICIFNNKSVFEFGS